jgi:hypothetical protein
MADAALFVGWGNAVRGRERQALKVFAEAAEFYTRLQQEGEIESFEPVFLELTAVISAASSSSAASEKSSDVSAHTRTSCD